MNCTDGKGNKCDLTADGWLCTPAPEHKRIVAMCVKHSQEVILEYHEKLGQAWTFQSDPGLWK